MDDLYHVSVRGELVVGVNEAQARSNLQALFKLSDDKLDLFFTGERLLVKRSLDRMTAQKYQKAITKAGMVCELIEVVDSTPSVAPEPEPRPPKRPMPEASEPSSGPEGAFSLAPVGADLSDQSEFKPLNIELGHLTLGNVGETLDQSKKPAPPAPPDTSHIQLADD